ncbi:hypothetical protein CFN78_01815 [Amycolatopsis antarctica]|uniref:34 kDa antigenic protein n=1 Tax=Amycolatopsis antarctica TaxID=1854586 RepID=A0A263D924_9PSEU|nr:DUF5336 domain-containing protein [Amycolatopsis antarctica]OZM74963.1 hypothetical protein CFN78_01815 [Amycolatopsis antarctica]
MTFPSSGPGYPQQGPHGPNTPGPEGGQFGQHAPQQAPRQGSAGITMSVPVMLALAATLFGLVSYFIGFAEDASYFDASIQFALVGGLLAALRTLPKGPRVLPFAALFSVLSALWGLQLVVRAPEGADVPGVIVVLLILAFVQMLIAIGALLADHGIIKAPAPKAPAPYGQQQPYGQPGQYGQDANRNPQGPASGGFAQPTQFAQPVNPQAPPPGQPSQQPTTYAPQQGQFYQQPGSETGQQNPPGTPPSGFGQPK